MVSSSVYYLPISCQINLFFVSHSHDVLGMAGYKAHWIIKQMVTLCPQFIDSLIGKCCRVTTGKTEQRESRKV